MTIPFASTLVVTERTWEVSTLAATPVEMTILRIVWLPLSAT